MKSTVMDAEPTEAEKEQWQKQQGEDQVHNDLVEAEIAAAKGECMLGEPFEGAAPEDAQARRWARGAFAREDFEPPVTRPVYTGPTTVDQITTHEELRSYVEHSEAQAREVHDGSDGLPAYEDAVSKFLIPRLQKQPAALEELVRSGNVGETAYKAALWLRDQNALPENFDRMSPDEFSDWLKHRFQGGIDQEIEKSPELLSRKEMNRMNRLDDPNEFAECLDYLKSRGR